MVYSLKDMLLLFKDISESLNTLYGVDFSVNNSDNDDEDNEDEIFYRNSVLFKNNQMNTDITGECMTYWKDGLCIKDKKINTYHTGEAMFSTESKECEIYNEEFRNGNLFRDDCTNLSLPTTSSIDQNIDMGIDETEEM